MLQPSIWQHFLLYHHSASKFRFFHFQLTKKVCTSLEKINSGLIPSLASSFLFGIKNIKTKFNDVCLTPNCINMNEGII